MLRSKDNLGRKLNFLANMIEAVAKAFPSRVAVLDDHGSITFSELWSMAGQRAHDWMADGFGPGHIAVLLGSRELGIVVDALAAWRAGAAYIWVDDKLPEVRRGRILSQLEHGYLVRDGVRDLSEVGPPSPLVPPQIVYLVFTSGTSGSPKGVMINDVGLTNLVSWFGDEIIPSSEIVVGSTASLGFDVMAMEVWGALCNGASVLLVSEKVRRDPFALAKEVSERSIDLLQLTTPLAELFLAYTKGVCGPLRTLITGGDVLKVPAVQFDAESFTLWNLYGPSESTVVASGQKIDLKLDVIRPSIGLPIRNMTFRATDSEGQLSPEGSVGELLIRGPGLATGYFGNPSATEAAFVFLPDDSRRWYRTGDLVRKSHSAYDFVGRIDQEQFNVSGVRIEASEIEAALSRVEWVGQSAVVAANLGENQIVVAYVVPAAGKSVGVLKDLRAALIDTVPSAVVPSRLMFLDSMPLTENGKVDRQALTAMHRSRSPE